MERVAFDEVDPTTYDPENRTHDRRPLSEPLGTEHVAINRYVLDPGEQFSGSLHAHADQEEVFVVVEGTATFEDRPADADASADSTDIEVGPGEAVRFAPGDFQMGYNDCDDPVVAFALGAPRESEDVRIARIPGVRDVSCPDCGHGSMAIAHEGDEALRCPECGTGWTPE